MGRGSSHPSHPSLHPNSSPKSGSWRPRIQIPKGLFPNGLCFHMNGHGVRDHARTHPHIHIHLRAPAHVHTHIHICTPHTHAHMHVLVCTYTHACAHSYTCMHTCTHIHAHRYHSPLSLHQCCSWAHGPLCSVLMCSRGQPGTVSVPSAMWQWAAMTLTEQASLCTVCGRGHLSPTERTCVVFLGSLLCATDLCVPHCLRDASLIMGAVTYDKSPVRHTDSSHFIPLS